MNEETKAAIFEARRRARECDEVHQENKRLRSELAETKTRLEYLIQENSDLEISLKQDLRSQAKNASFVSGAWPAQGSAIFWATASRWTAAEHGIPLPPPVYCTNASCEAGPTWLLLTLLPRVSLAAKTSCEGPAPVAPKKPTGDVRVWRGGSRLVGVNRRAAMRALQTGMSLPGYAAKVRFATADGRTLAAEDIDWTGFGLQPTISAHRVLVLGKRGILDPSFERDAVLAEFQRTGTLPAGYQFPLKYWNLKPQDVNFVV